MTRVLPPVIPAAAAEVTALADLVAEAFSTLDAARWLVPDPEVRRAAMAGQFALLVEHALAFGHVDLLADGSAVAVWLHRTRPIPAPPDYDRRLDVACGEHADRFRILDALFDAHHPGEPHHHLAMLAVTPRCQGTGRGTVLLRHHHSRLDAGGIPAYLEAADLRCRALYAREGYVALTPFVLPDSDARFHPMWRPPHLCLHP